MPHLQEKPVDDKAEKGMNGKPSIPHESELPITEAKEGYLGANDGLLTIKGMTSSSSNSPLRAVSEDTSCTPQPHVMKQSVITPSPYGSLSEYPGAKAMGPIMTIYGSKKLVPSPIRVKRRVSRSEDDNDEELSGPGMSQPRNLRYVDSYTTPTKHGVAHTISEGMHTDEQPPMKRLLGQLEKGEAPVAKKSRVENIESSPREESAELKNENQSVHDSSEMKKQSIISPTPSAERGDEEGIAPSWQQGMAYPPFQHHHMEYSPHYPPYPPRRQHYGHRAHAFGHQPYPGGGYPPIYNGYPPHLMPPSHFMGRPGAPPSPYYPPYPTHNPAMMHQYPRTMPPQQYRSAQHGSLHCMMGGRPPAASELPRQRATPTAQEPPAIQSVAEWREAAMTTGKPPSAKRCYPLTEPIPSKYWGNAEKTEDAILPDFHQLVNYPDYLVKSRNSSTPDSNQLDTGKRNCVMCGKLRVCSASSYVGRGRGTTKPAEAPPSVDEEDDSSAHIIPRQNKGLCTACDVTVWVVATEGLEIKWCKGCKNFRPWAAFGDKGSATKCVRCRDRQREKYAIQKDELRHRKYKRSASTNSSSSSIASQSNEDATLHGMDESSHLQAAQGLHNLINAAQV